MRIANVLGRKFIILQLTGDRNNNVNNITYNL